MEADLLMLMRLAVAALLSAIIGWEREHAGKAAGLRTHMMVGLASALFVMMAEVAIARYGGESDLMRFDPIRAIEAVATGIGFIGAGTIFLSRGAARVQGLTTAASIWATAAVGVAVGLGEFILAGGAALLIVIILRVLLPLDVR